MRQEISAIEYAMHSIGIANFRKCMTEFWSHLGRNKKYGMRRKIKWFRLFSFHSDHSELFALTLMIFFFNSYHLINWVCQANETDLHL